MPFLRNKRGNPTSDSEMRRATLVLPDHIPPSKEPPPLRNAVSNIDFAALRPSTSRTTADADAHLHAYVDADADADAESGDGLANGSNPAIPAPPVTPPHDSPPSSTAENALPSHDPIDRPDSPPIQDETPKHRAFSMLRFRNASDSQLSARAKRQAQAQADDSVPPVPRRMLDQTLQRPSQSSTLR